MSDEKEESINIHQPEQEALQKVGNSEASKIGTEVEAIGYQLAEYDRLKNAYCPNANSSILADFLEWWKEQPERSETVIETGKVWLKEFGALKLDRNERRRYIQNCKARTEGILESIDVVIQGEPDEFQTYLLSSETLKDELSTLPEAFMIGLRTVVLDNASTKYGGNGGHYFFKEAQVNIHWPNIIPISEMMSLESSFKYHQIISNAKHEIGHNVLYNLATVDDLYEWDAIEKAHPEAISWNTQNYLDKKIQDPGASEEWEAAKKRESFCDSLEMFFEAPELLYALSYDRFLFMLNFVSDYMSMDQADIIEKKLNLAQKRGKDLIERINNSEIDIQRIKDSWEYYRSYGYQAIDRNGEWEDRNMQAVKGAMAGCE